MTRSCRRNARPVGGCGGPAPTRSPPSVRGRPAVLQREQNVPRRIDEPSPNPTRRGCLKAAVATLLAGWAWLRRGRRQPQRGSPRFALKLGHSRRQRALCAMRARGLPLSSPALFPFLSSSARITERDAACSVTERPRHPLVLGPASRVV